MAAGHVVNGRRLGGMQPDAASLRTRFDGREVSLTTDGERWANDAYTGSARRPLSTPILILAALVLLAEAIIARGSGERSSRGTVKAAA